MAGLVLLSPVLSGIKVITSTPLLCCLDIFTNHKRIRRVRAPTLIIHGALDEDVPVRDRRRPCYYHWYCYYYATAARLLLLPLLRHWYCFYSYYFYTRPLLPLVVQLLRH